MVELFCYVVLVSNVWKNAGMTMTCNRKKKGKRKVHGQMEVTQIKEVLERSVALADETVENGQNAVHGAPQWFAVMVLHRHRKRQTRNSHSEASYTTAWAQCPNGLLWWSCTDTESVKQKNSHNEASYTTAWVQLDMGWEWAATVTSTTRTS